MPRSCASSSSCSRVRSPSIRLLRLGRFSSAILRHYRDRSGASQGKKTPQIQPRQQLDAGAAAPYNRDVSVASWHVARSEGGDLDSTEIRFRRMRAEDHHPRQKMEKQVTANTQLALAA